jgi:hypothetical protein
MPESHIANWPELGKTILLPYERLDRALKRLTDTRPTGPPEDVRSYQMSWLEMFIASYPDRLAEFEAFVTRVLAWRDAAAPGLVEEAADV